MHLQPLNLNSERRPGQEVVSIGAEGLQEGVGERCAYAHRDVDTVDTRAQRCVARVSRSRRRERRMGSLA